MPRHLAARLRHAFPIDQFGYAILYLIAYRPDFRGRQTLWIAKRPIITSQTWNIRAFISASHRDEKLRLLRQLFRKLLRPCMAQVDADLLHYSQHLRMNAFAWFRARRYSRSLQRICQMVEECGSHL